MRRTIFVIALITLFGGVYSQETNRKEIKWYTIEEAIELNKKNPKKIFIDFYTTWCGWCKRMDATTFSHPWIIDYMNQHFYPVKFNAESKKPVAIGDKEFVNKNVNSGRRGAHQFAIAILQGKLSYPSVAFLDEKVKLLFTVPGYRRTSSMETLLVWVATEKYKDIAYDEFTKTYESKIK